MPLALTVFLLFASVSLVAFGGGSAVVPELHSVSVVQYHWVTDRQFVDIFAITNITPGPTMLFICILGWRAAGWLGMVAATIGMFGPTSIVTYYVRRVWDKFEKSEWRHAVEMGLAPIGVGLLMSGAMVLARGACVGPITIGIAAATCILMTFTRINLLVIMAIAGIAGLFGN